MERVIVIGCPGCMSCWILSGSRRMTGCGNGRRKGKTKIILHKFRWWSDTLPKESAGNGAVLHQGSKEFSGYNTKDRLALLRGGRFFVAKCRLEDVMK